MGGTKIAEYTLHNVCLSSVTCIHTVRFILQQENKTSYLAFLDVSKALWREGLWCKMRYYGVDKKFVKVCEGLYSGVETRDVMNGVKSRWFGVLGLASLVSTFV